MWKINDRTREYIIKNGLKQNSETGFSASERTYGVKKRNCTKGYIHKRLQNGDLKTRNWLVYSPSKGFVVCAYCKLFGNEAPSNFCEGFNDWKNAYIALKSHENSPAQRTSVLSFVCRAKVDNRIDKQLLQACKSEKKIAAGSFKTCFCNN